MDPQLIDQLTWAGRLLVAAAVLLGLGRLVRRWPGVAAPLAAAGGVGLVFALTVIVCFLRPVPAPEARWLFEGVRYERKVGPGRRVAHVVTIDLSSPGLKILVTPPLSVSTPTSTWQIPARRTTEFLTAYDQQLAVNANFFYRQFSHGILHYRPRTGDGVNVVGWAMSGRRLYGRQDPSMRTLWFFEDGHAEITRERRPAQHAVSGYPLLVDGRMPKAVVRADDRQPRVAAAVDRAGRRLILVVVDGRVPLYAKGATLPSLAALCLKAGAHQAIILDGGGSSTLVTRSIDGRPVILNLPVHGRIPAGYERPVANHLGFSGLRPAK